MFDPAFVMMAISGIIEGATEAAAAQKLGDKPYYWLCCGSLDPLHRDERAQSCIERKIGHPEHCQWVRAR